MSIVFFGNRAGLDRGRPILGEQVTELGLLLRMLSESAHAADVTSGHLKAWETFSGRPKPVVSVHAGRPIRVRR